MSRYHKVVPSVDGGGYPLNPVRGEFSVVRPKEGFNYIEDPSMDTLPETMYPFSHSIYYDWYGLNLSDSGRSYTEQMFGVYSFKMTPHSSVDPKEAFFSQVLEIPSEKFGVFSLYAKGTIGIPFYIVYMINWKRYLKQVYGDGKWNRYDISFFNPAMSERLDVYLYLTQSNQIVYTDGWQVEVFGEDEIERGVTTFIPDKVRLLGDYTGGYEVNLQDLGLIITGHQGLGMPEVSNTTTFLGLFDGSVFQNAKYQERKFSINGRILANSVTHLAKIKRDLLDLLSPIRTSQRSLIRLVYQRRDDRGNPIGYKRYIDCSYESGMEGKPIGSSEDLTISFVAPDPFFSEEKDNAVKITSSGTTKTISVLGNAPTFPIFKLFPTDPIRITSISNVSAGKTVTFDLTTIMGDIVIDTQKGSFELNGISYPGKILSGSLRELAMTGGDNLMSAVFTGAGVFVQWKNRWMGID